MWFENFDNYIFLNKLYLEKPLLIDVRIAKIEILDEGDRVSLLFDMPYYADTPPEKWKVNGYNSIIVQMDFFAIRELAIKSVNNTYSGTIDICKTECDFLKVTIIGTVNIDLVAESGIIQSVEGYCKDIS